MMISGFGTSLTYTYPPSIGTLHYKSTNKLMTYYYDFNLLVGTLLGTGTTIMM